MSWMTLHWTDQLIEHQDDKYQDPFYVSAEHADAVVRYMESHGFVCRGRFSIPDEMHDHCVWLDPGGMVAVNAPREEFEFFGTKVGLRSEDVEWAQGYFKRPGQLIESLNLIAYPTFYRFVIFTAEQRIELLRQLDRIAPEAEERARAFWANRKTPNQALAEHNLREHGATFCGPDKHERFRKESP